MPDSEALRRTYLFSNGFLHPLYIDEEFRQAGVFIETMEKFIDSSLSEEVQRLEAEAVSLPAEEADEFWAWNYPEHWEELFGSRIRSAFCTQLCSQIEGILGTLSQRVQVLVRSPISVKDLKGGGTLDQHRKYLRVFGQFTKPSPQLWDQMNHIFRLRNIFVHEDGYLNEQRDRNLINFLSSLPNIKIRRGGSIELQAGACPPLLATAKQFSDDLFTEYESLVHRLRRDEEQR